MVHIQKTKMYVYHGQFTTNFLQQLLHGENITESATIHRYPKDGFELADAEQRRDAFTTLFKVFKFSISDTAKISSAEQPFKTSVKVSPRPHQPANSEQQDAPVKEIVVINAPISEGEKVLSSLSTPPPSVRSPRRQSPRRSASPKRAGSPKRKHNSDLEIGSDSPRPTKRTATVDAVAPTEELKPVKVQYLKNLKLMIS